MKTKLLIAFLVMFGTVAMAQEKEEKEKKEKVEVPAAVSQAFQKDYPSIKDVSWDAEDGEFEAEFKIDGVEASANYDKTGHKKEFEIAIKIEELSKVITNYITKNYSEYKLVEAAKMTSDKNIVTYEAAIKKEKKKLELIFDAAGKFMKKSKGD